MADRRPALVIRNSLKGTAVRVSVLAVLLVAVFVALRYNDRPELAVSLYALIPILLAVFWFGMRGGLLTATAAMLSFLVDVLITPSGLAGVSLVLATVNRSVVFFGMAVLVTLLLRRERALAVRLREQERELGELESLRAALTPSEVPARPHLDIATSFRPAEELVAGDFFLVVEGPTDSTTIVVGDVVGHGLEAARCAAFVRTALALFAAFTSDPAQLLQLANVALAERSKETPQFVTAVCMNIGGAAAPAVRWAAAGHESPWYLDTGTSLAGGHLGAPLGVAYEALDVEMGRTSLRPGEGVLMFTDGLVEGRRARRDLALPLELFDEERARSIVREQRGAPPARVLEALDSAVATFAGGSLADDLCLVAVRVRPSPPPALTPEGPANQWSDQPIGTPSSGHST